MINVDVEPDPFHPVSPDPWYGFEAAYRYLTDLRPVLEDRTGAAVRFCWFLRMDPAIEVIYGDAQYVARSYEKLLGDLMEHGDEIGLHTHLYRWLPSKKSWRLNFYDQQWIDDCVQSSLSAYAEAFGGQCSSIRFGFWINHHTVELLNRSGVRYDLSLNPGQRPRWRFELSDHPIGWYPSLLNIPREPYHPSRTDFRRMDSQDSMEITMIPLTITAQHGISGIRDLVGRSLGILGSGFQYADRSLLVSLDVGAGSGINFGQMVDQVLNATANPYLSLIVRSCFGTRPDVFSRVQESFDYLLNNPNCNRLVFSTPAKAIEILHQNRSEGNHGDTEPTEGKTEL